MYIIPIYILHALLYIVRAVYTHLVGQYCAEESVDKDGKIYKYATLQAAKAACDNDYECNCVYDIRCKGRSWNTGKGFGVRNSTIGSCAWINSNKSKSC